MRFLSALAIAFALLSAAPAAAQTQDRLGEVGTWLTRFAEAMAEPNKAAAACAPQLQAAVSRMHDAASARTALAATKPCADRIRAAYQQSIVKLDALESLPAGSASAASLSTDKFVAEQRRLAGESIAYMDKVERLLEAIIANDRAALPRLANDVRLGGVVLIDSNILMFRLQKEISQFQSSRQVADVRILIAESSKALMAASQSPNGIAAGSRLAELAGQAKQLRPNLLNAWSADKTRLDALRGGGDGDDVADRVIVNLEPMVQGVATDSDRLAETLAKAGAKPVLSFAEATRLAAELQAIEFQLQNRARTLGSALAAGS